MGRFTNFRLYTHKECANFSNGLCALSGAVVDPDGVACPNFIPKRMMVTPQLGRRKPQTQQLRCLPPIRRLLRYSYPIQQLHYSPRYLPNFWKKYNYRMVTYFMYPWSLYNYFAYFMIAWLNFHRHMWGITIQHML